MLVKTVSGFVRQYAPTVRGDAVRFDPSVDCDGYFSASKYMYYNNCYNYACAIASNSFAYPGRASGFSLSRPYTGDSVTKAAKSDGLQIPEKDGEIIPLATLQEAREFAAPGTHALSHHQIMENRQIMLKLFLKFLQEL